MRRISSATDIREKFPHFIVVVTVNLIGTITSVRSLEEVLEEVNKK